MLGSSLASSFGWAGRAGFLVTEVKVLFLDSHLTEPPFGEGSAVPAVQLQTLRRGGTAVQGHTNTGVRAGMGPGCFGSPRLPLSPAPAACLQEGTVWGQEEVPHAAPLKASLDHSPPAWLVGFPCFLGLLALSLFFLKTSYALQLLVSEISSSHLLVLDNPLCPFLPDSVDNHNGKQGRVHPAWAPAHPDCPVPFR